MSTCRIPRRRRSDCGKRPRPRRCGGWCQERTSVELNWEEAEAAEAARQEMARHQRAAKRALLRDVRGFESRFPCSESFRLKPRRRQKTRRTRSRDQAPWCYEVWCGALSFRCPT